MSMLSNLENLRQWMVEHRVRHARLGDMEITLGDDGEPTYQAVALPGMPPPLSPPPPVDPLDDPMLFGGEVPNFRIPEDK